MRLRALDPVQAAGSLVGMRGSWMHSPPDPLPVSAPGMGPGAAATGHADGAGQWFAGCKLNLLLKQVHKGSGVVKGGFCRQKHSCSKG